MGVNTREITEVLEAWGEEERSTEVVAHHIKRQIKRTVEELMSTVGTDTGCIVFCDDKHYRVTFRIGNDWHLLDSLGVDNTFMKDVWPTIHKMNPLFKTARH